MKINKKNVIIPSLLTTISAALVGSIAGTVAWYQYNTRVSASYYGTSAGSATENLQLRLGDNGEWKTELKAAEIQTYLNQHGHIGSQLRPVTTGAQRKDGDLGKLYKNPIYQHAKTSTWGLANDEEDYITFPISLRVKDIDGGQDTTNFIGLEKKVYLQNVVLKGSNTNDITDAIRLHVGGHDNSVLLSEDGGKTKVHGKLDLLDDGQPAYDKTEGYDDFGDPRHYVDYGFDPDEIDGYVNHEADLINKNDYWKVAYASDDELNDQYFQFDGTDWNPVAQRPDNGHFVGQFGEETDLPDSPTLDDYALVLYAADDLTNDKYFQFDGTGWVDTLVSAGAPAVGVLRDELSEESQLPVLPHQNDIYFAEEDNKLFKFNGSTWDEVEVVSESYAQNSAAVIADDSDPDQISGGKVLGSTIASVYKKEQLPAAADYNEGDKIYVRNESAPYVIKGGVWTKLLASANDEFYQYEESSHSWVLVADEPADPTANKGEIDENEPGLFPNDPDDGDYVKIIHKAEDEDNARPYLTLNLTIYLEGWQELANGGTLWDSGYIGTDYKVGMTFVCEAR